MNLTLLRPRAERVSGRTGIPWETIIDLMIEIISGCLADEATFLDKAVGDEIGLADYFNLRLRIRNYMRTEGVAGRSKRIADELIREYRLPPVGADEIDVDELGNLHCEAMAVAELKYTGGCCGGTQAA